MTGMKANPLAITLGLFLCCGAEVALAQYNAQDLRYAERQQVSRHLQQYGQQQYAQQQNQSRWQQIMGLPWVTGPVEVQVGKNATFYVPLGYRYLYPRDTARFMELTQNLPPSEGKSLFAPDDVAWFGTFDYEDVGHVFDQEPLDANSLLDRYRRGASEHNKQRTERGWPTVEITGWAYAPYYDPATRNLSWAVNMLVSDGHETTNFDTRLLGRTGYTAVKLVTGPDRLRASVGEFSDVVTGYRFIDSHAYAAFKPGDKVATYGLAALITGGAVAVAAKTGLWKGILAFLAGGWKFIAMAFAAVSVTLGKLFKPRGNRK